MFEALKNLIANDIVALIALVALVSPPITAIIDNLFKLIAKHLDFKRNVYDNEFNHKRDLFENFLSYTGQLHLDSDRYINGLMKAYFALSPYVSKEDFVYFREYCNLVQENNPDKNQERLTFLLNEHIVPCIKKELRRYKPSRK